MPLEAPVILLHGTNGAGKTSVMSALQLALTGQLSGVSDTDKAFLVHREARSDAYIALTTSTEPYRFNIEDGRQAPQHGFLGPEDADFFNERCYLTQATLGRLLEIYQAAPPGSDSPLTKFVNELLKLDQLNALIDGLQAVGDKRNVKNLVPAYRAAEDELREIDQSLQSDATEFETLARAEKSVRERLEAVVEGLRLHHTRPRDIEAERGNREAGEQMVRLSQLRRELAGARRQWQELGGPSTADSATAEDARKARDAFRRWWVDYGASLQRFIDELGPEFVDLSPRVSERPMEVWEESRRRLTAMLSRSEIAIDRDERLVRELDKLAAAGAGARERLETVQAALGDPTRQSETQRLIRLLAELEAHLKNDVCPVCGRDFGEVSEEPLSSHIASEISKASQEAARLQTLTKALAEASADLQALEVRWRRASSERLPKQTLASFRSSAQVARSSIQTLDQRFRTVADEGLRIIGAWQTAEQLLAEISRRNQTLVQLHRDIEHIGQAVTGRPPEPTVGLQGTLDALDAAVAAQMAALERLQAQEIEAADLRDELRRTTESRIGLEHDRETRMRRRELIAAAVRELERQREVAKTLRSDASRARTDVVRRVFTGSLNSVWRDLFVRLAPGEPFVPAFRIPDDGAVAAVLETIHRDGRRGGAPGAMLSAGNLNTAALTLFLALHLSASRRVPWLLLDDPVQSMDEVHVSQFAALLRTVAKGQHRQVVIAVHERALFDYLALELSPAFPGDSLVTVELTRASDRDTLADARSFVYEEEQELAVS